MNKVFANVHSIETLGTLDGPGIRFVLFLQGCPMRCLYCHNPDTWENTLNQKMSIEEILNKFDGVKEFLKNGGITVTGGEPLLQIDFLIEFFKRAKEKNIHTALDTSGILFNRKNTVKIDELLKYTDLVMLDIKHIDPVEHKKLTGFDNSNILDFAKYLEEKQIPVWIRHVVVPEITFKEEYLKQLGKFIATLKNVKAVDVLAYHNMAREKYKQLNIDYKLKDIEPLSKQDALKAKKIIFESIKKARGINK